MVNAMRMGITSDRQQRQVDYQRDTKEWQERYPENPNVLVARQLRRFLEASADVDYAARIATQGGVMRFVNPQYEEKSSEWKICYRAGKEAVTVARTAAAAWLKELGAI